MLWIYLEFGAWNLVLKILQAPHPILSAPAKPVKFKNGQLSSAVKRLIKQMKKALIETSNPKGVGLSANQIGKSYQIFIIRPWPKSAIRVFINPKIITRSRRRTCGVPERDNKLEGCLSIKDAWGLVKRSKWVRLKYQDEFGRIHRGLFKGFSTTIIQHELDHLQGKLFTQKCLEQGNKVFTKMSNS